MVQLVPPRHQSKEDDLKQSRISTGTLCVILYQIENKNVTHTVIANA